MKTNNILNGLMMTGTPGVDVAILGADEPGYSGGNIGLNYLFPKPVASPVDFVYNGNDAIEEEDEQGFLDNLFPCINACKGTGAEKKNCLAECRGKLKSGQRKTLDLKNDQTIANAMAELAKNSGTPAPTSSNTVLWIVLVLVFLMVLGFVAFLLMRKKQAV